MTVKAVSTKILTSEVEVGKPYLWKSGIYGDIAVHVVGFSPNNKVVKLSIDGGEDSAPSRNHLALKDGIGYCVVERGELHKRPARRTARAAAVKAVPPSEGKPARKSRITAKGKSPIYQPGNKETPAFSDDPSIGLTATGHEGAVEF